MATENSDPDDFAGSVADNPQLDAAPDQRPPGGDMTRAALVSTLEGQIVPRLLLLCRSQQAGSHPAGSGATAVTAGDVEEWARLLLAHGPEMADEFAEVLRHCGVTDDRILPDLIHQAAIQLAHRWESQDLDYPQLVRGLGALRTVVKRYQ